jgi:hypothetical protein
MPPAPEIPAEPLPFEDALKSYERHVRHEYDREYRKGFVSGLIFGAAVVGIVAFIVLETSSAKVLSLPSRGRE